MPHHRTQCVGFAARLDLLGEGSSEQFALAILEASQVLGKVLLGQLLKSRDERSGRLISWDCRCTLYLCCGTAGDELLRSVLGVSPDRARHRPARAKKQGSAQTRLILVAIIVMLTPRPLLNLRAPPTTW